MTKLIKGNQRMIEELIANLLAPICTNENGEVVGIESMGSEQDGYCVKIDTDMLSDIQIMVIEAGLSSRVQSGVLTGYEPDMTLIQNTFALTANSPEKVEIVLKDILGGAKVSDENIIVLQQPYAEGMYNTLTPVIIAFNLNQDQMNAIQLSTKVAQQGIKITNFTKKASMIMGSSAHVVNRVGREVTLATVEVGATVGVGVVKTGVEATACVANIALKELNHKELMKGDNVQSLMKTVKSMFKKDNNATKLSTGFGAL